MTGAEGVVDHNLTMSPRVTARAQKKETLESKLRTCILLLRSNTSISNQTNIAGLDMMHVSLIAWDECNYKQVLMKLGDQKCNVLDNLHMH